MTNSFDFVQLGNRTKAPLNVTYDGKQWTLPPFPATIAVPKIVADAACRQHPIMGTEDPYNPRSYGLLVYVKEWDQLPSTPIEQSASLERLDRSLLPPDRQNPTRVEQRYRPVREAGDSDSEAVIFKG